MDYIIEEFPNRLILPTEWRLKKKMKPVDAPKYAYDNKYSCFNYEKKDKGTSIFFYTHPYNYCKSLAFQERYYNKNAVTVLVRSS